MRLIDADALSDYIKIWSVGDGIGHTSKDVLAAVDRQPTIEAAPVVHGEWVRCSYYRVKCSICENQQSELETDNFCPHCGAKMDGKRV